MSENTRFRPEVYFEPGIHSLNGVDSAIQKTISGDVNLHSWNEAVRERMKSYRPGVIAVDSMIPMGIDDDGRVNLEDKATIWNFMPGRPSEINGTGEVLVIAGDNTDNFPSVNDLAKLELRVIGAASIVGLAYLAGSAIDQTLPAKEVPVAIIPEPDPPIYDWEREGDVEDNTKPYDWVKEEKDQPPEPMMSRRRFFGRAAVILTLSSFMSDPIAALSPWRFPERFAGDADTAVESITPQRIIDPDHMYEYLSGRTALLIAKTSDVIEMLHAKDHTVKGSVVMGYSHSFQANDLLNDPVMRDSYIRRHTELMLQNAEKSSSNFTGQWTEAERQQWVMQNQAKLQIFRVLEPNDISFKADPKAELDRVVQLVETTTSPSTSAAIDGLLRVQGI